MAGGWRLAAGGRIRSIRWRMDSTSLNLIFRLLSILPAETTDGCSYTGQTTTRKNRVEKICLQTRPNKPTVVREFKFQNLD